MLHQHRVTRSYLVRRGASGCDEWFSDFSTRKSGRYMTGLNQRDVKLAKIHVRARRPHPNTVLGQSPSTSDIRGGFGADHYCSRLKSDLGRIHYVIVVGMLNNHGGKLADTCALQIIGNQCLIGRNLSEQELSRIWPGEEAIG